MRGGGGGRSWGAGVRLDKFGPEPLCEKERAVWGVLAGLGVGGGGGGGGGGAVLGPKHIQLFPHIAC